MIVETFGPIYEMTFPVIGAPMTDAWMCPTCAQAPKMGSYRAVTGPEIQALKVTRYCDGCNLLLASVAA